MCIYIYICVCVRVIYLSISLSLYLSTYLSIHLPTYLPTYLSIYRYIYIYIYVCVCVMYPPQTRCLSWPAWSIPYRNCLHNIQRSEEHLWHYPNSESNRSCIKIGIPSPKKKRWEHVHFLLSVLGFTTCFSRGFPTFIAGIPDSPDSTGSSRCRRENGAGYSPKMVVFHTKKGLMNAGYFFCKRDSNGHCHHGNLVGGLEHFLFSHILCC